MSTELEENVTADAPEIPEVPRITTKQRVLEARGQEVALDYFLFSCLESERLSRHRVAKGGVYEIAWPVLPADPEAPAPEQVTSNELGALLEQLFKFYADNFRDLNDPKAMDHEQLHLVVGPIVALNRDLGRLCRAKTGEDLPEYDKASPATIWTDLELLVQKHFPVRAKYFTRYLQWSRAVEPREEWEPGSRPPVGRYAPPPPPRAGRDGGRGGRDGGRGGPGGGRGGRDRGPPRGDRPDRGPRPERQAPAHHDEEGEEVAPREATDAEVSEARDSAGDRPRRERPERSERGDRGDRPRHDRGDRGDRGGRDRGPRREREDDGETARLTEAAMAEVDRAIADLQGNSGLEEVTLKPTNSFYRRIQHQKIVDAGFHSFSVGEGPDRAVKVSRKEG